MTGEFSVCYFCSDGSYEFVKRHVDGEEAVKAFNHYTKFVACLSVITRVIIVDGGDQINYEWKKGIGITFPKEGHGGQELTTDEDFK